MQCTQREDIFIDGPRIDVLKKLSACRGHRAYAESLFSCIDDAGKVSARRLHNVCVPLFGRGLIEKVRGMYQLTPSGLDLVRSL